MQSQLMECARKFKETTSKLCNYPCDTNYVTIIEELDKHIAEAMTMIPSTPRNATERALRAAINETCVARMAIIPTDTSINVKQIWIDMHKIWIRAEMEIHDIMETDLFWKSVCDITSESTSSISDAIMEQTIVSEMDALVATIDAAEIASLIADIDAAEIKMLMEDIDVATTAWKRFCHETVA